MFKKISFEAGEVKRYGLAAAAGIVLATAFPKWSMAGFAWVMPGLILMAALGCRGAVAFRIGFVGGLGFYLASLSWILCIPVSVAPVLGWVSLAAYCAIYTAVWVWGCWQVFPRPREVADRQSSVSSGFLDLLDLVVSVSWPQRFAWALFCGVWWVALEMILARLFTGFPWILLGISQYRILHVIQIASWTGVYGVSFLLVWFSVSLSCGLAFLVRRPAARWHSQREIFVPLLVGFLCVAFGWRELTHRSAEVHPTLKIALIQPSIPQTWIWDPKESSNRFQQLLQLSERALTNHPDLLVWPEAAVPYMFRFDEEIFEAVTNLVQKHKIWLVLGSDDGQVRVRPNGAFQTNYFNSSFLVSPSGEIQGTYRKRRLVIFGEYIPFGRNFGWIEQLTGMGSFTPGEQPVNFAIPDLRVKAAILICFEDVFPHLTRTSVEEDTDMLLNLTNNGWFGESAAQWQHAAAAIFRAIENGLPLVRCANNGLTCWVDSCGAMHDVYFPGTTDIYGVGYKLIQVPLLAGRKRAPTFYHQYGDWFGWTCVALGALVVLWQFRKWRPTRP